MGGILQCMQKSDPFPRGQVELTTATVGNVYVDDAGNLFPERLDSDCKGMRQ